MTTGTESEPTLQSSLSPEDATQRGLLRVETKLAKAEAQILTMQEAISDLTRAMQKVQQRALYLRIGLLLALVGAFFYLRAL